MDLFVIVCSTCKQRLKVRDASHVGSIQACPKCGAMVLVQPPADWKPPEGAPGPTIPSSQSAPVRPPPTRVGPAFSTDMNAPAPPAPIDPSLRETAFDRDFDDISALLDGAGASAKKRPGDKPTAPAASPTPTPGSGAKTPGPQRPNVARPSAPGVPLASLSQANTADDWEAPPRADEAPGATGSSIPKTTADKPVARATPQPTPPRSTPSVVLKPSPSPKPVVALASTSPASTSPALPIEDSFDSPDPPRRGLAIAATVLAVVLGVALTIGAAWAIKRSLAGNPSPVARTPPTPVPSVDVDKPPAPEEATDDTSEPPAESYDPAVDESPAPAVDPTESEPAEVESPAEPPPTETPGDSEPARTGDDPADPLKLIDDGKKPERPANDPLRMAELDKYLDPGARPEPGDFPSARKPPVVEPPKETETRPRPPPREIDLTARLADKIEAIEIPKVPLASVVKVLSDFSTAPISLDPEELAIVSASVETPVEGKFTKSAVGDVLAKILAPLKLELVREGATLRVAASSSPRLARYAIDDLAPADDAKAALAAMVAKLALVSAAPTDEDSPSEDDKPASKTKPADSPIRLESGRLIVEHGERAHFLARRTLDLLRGARGLPAKEGFAPDDLVVEGAAKSTAKTLAAPLRLQFAQATPLATILTRMSEEAKTTIAIDWAGLAEAGWSPDADATSITAGEPLSQALDALLKPMDLGWEVVASGRILVSSPAALARRVRLELYSVVDLVDEDGDRLVDSLDEELQGADRALAYDEPSKSIVARLSLDDHRRLTRNLNSRREKSP